jgi:hypothetical protein
LLRNTRLEKQNARIVTPRRWAHELRTWRAWLGKTTEGMACGSSVYGEVWVGVAMGAGTMLAWNERRALLTTAVRDRRERRGEKGREDEG